MRSSPLTLGLTLGLMLAPARAAWSSGHAGIDRPGGTFAHLPDAGSAAACFAACSNTDSCQAWVASGEDCLKPGCELKDSVPAQALAVDGCTVHSGVRAAADKGLMPLKYKPLRLGQTAPTGWLRNQLVIQANSLSGHLDHFWADVNESVWIGGKADHTGAGHERGPYWLNGVVPLAAQLNGGRAQSSRQTRAPPCGHRTQLPRLYVCAGLTWLPRAAGLVQRAAMPPNSTRTSMSR
jgi:hypothetical protein